MLKNAIHCQKGAHLRQRKLDFKVVSGHRHCRKVYDAMRLCGDLSNV